MMPGGWSPAPLDPTSLIGETTGMADHAAPYVPPVYSTRGQLGRDAAVRYQDVAVPWIFGPFGEALVELAAPRRGETLLDVGCGTGAATRPAAFAVGPAGRVVGLDINVGMLEVARGFTSTDAVRDDGTASAPVEWLEASAEALPLANRSFDVVIANQSIQFPAETAAVAGEIRRVLRPGGRLGFTAWRAPSASPYFAAEIDAVAMRLGPEAADGLLAGFGLAEPARLVTALAVAGVADIETRRIDLILDLPPLADWAPRHLAATPVAAALASAPGLARELGADIAQAMAEYITPDGVRAPFSSWYIGGVAPAV
jgi:SAM-dependent methyltransferase